LREWSLSERATLLSYGMSVLDRHMTGTTKNLRGSHVDAFETLSTCRCPFCSFHQFLTGSSPEGAFHLHRYLRCIPASSLQKCCDGCGVHRENLGLTMQSHHAYRTCGTISYTSFDVFRFRWHALVPFGFHLQVSQRPKGILLPPFPAFAGITNAPTRRTSPLQT
jgi:hypothetical protein